MNENKQKYQANQYDKILKENIEVVIPNLMQNMLGIIAISSEELPDDIQHTKERKPDFLKKITDSQGNTFVLQIEFQVANEPEMVYRMGEYYFMLARKYKLPIRQFVIYIGTKKPTMAIKLEQTPFLYFEYALVLIAQQDYEIFLKSNQPEEVILGVLANFENQIPENALRKIIARLEEITDNGLALKKHFKQLRILAQLRKLEQKLKEIIMDNVAKYIDEEKDVAYLIGQEKEQTKFITFLLNSEEYSFDQIATIVGVSVNFVKNIQQNLIASIN